MSKLQNYIGFVNSLINMDEVKKGDFPTPQEITYSLSNDEHISLQYEIHMQKKQYEQFNPDDIFYITLMGVDLKFIKK